MCVHITLSRTVWQKSGPRASMWASMRRGKARQRLATSSGSLCACKWTSCALENYVSTYVLRTYVRKRLGPKHLRVPLTSPERVMSPLPRSWQIHCRSSPGRLSATLGGGENLFPRYHQPYDSKAKSPAHETTCTETFIDEYREGREGLIMESSRKHRNEGGERTFSRSRVEKRPRNSLVRAFFPRRTVPANPARKFLAQPFLRTYVRNF